MSDFLYLPVDDLFLESVGVNLVEFFVLQRAIGVRDDSTDELLSRFLCIMRLRLIDLCE